MTKVNLKYNSLYLVLVLAFPIVLGCNKFLEKAPSKSTAVEITTASQLDVLLNDYTSMYMEANRTAVWGSDDNGLNVDLYKARPATSAFNVTNVQFYLWDNQYIPNDAGETFWQNEWKKVFTANLVLNKISSVTGTDAEKTYLTADAYFLRAYSYFQLVNTYCLPYSEANRSEMGLPLKNATSFEESLERSTLEATWQFIEADLKEALKVDKPLIQNGVARHWRSNKAAVNGFAARFYLYKNNYTEALKYANAALAEHSQLMDYNVDMRYGIDINVTLDAGTAQQKSVTLKFPYTHNNNAVLTDLLQWKELMYLRMLYTSTNWFIPSQSLMDVYDQAHDLRYLYHIVEGYSYQAGLNNPSYNYPGYVFFYQTRIPSGPTTAEMYVIKAECLARDNKVPEALTAINTLRAKRMAAGSWVNLTAASQEEAVRKILEERRREMPFSQRWFDIRRYNNNDDPADDVSLSREFYNYTSAAVSLTDPVKTYTLPKQSRRFAAPIPAADISSSGGTIKQNTY